MMSQMPVSGGALPVRRASSCSESRPLKGAAIRLARVLKN